MSFFPQRFGFSRRRGFRRRGGFYRTFAKRTSIKSQQVLTAAAEAGGVNRTVDLLSVVDNYTGTAGQLKTGSIVKWFYFEISIGWADVNDANGTRIDWYLIKDPNQAFVNAGNFPAIPFTTADAARRFVIKAGAGTLGVGSQGSVPYVWRGFIRVPKKLQRCGDNDIWNLRYRITDINSLNIHAMIITKMDV